MGWRNLRTVVALVGAAALTSALTACGDDDGGGGADGAGKTLNVLIGANTQYPQEFQDWQKSISDQFNAQTGATVKFETFASANEELTKIQTSVVSGSGPDVYAVCTTLTPTAYSTGAFVKLGDKEWQDIGGKDKFVPATLGISGPDDQNQVGVPWVSRPFVMAYNTFRAVSALTRPGREWALDTVEDDTPASCATSYIVGRRSMTHMLGRCSLSAPASRRGSAGYCLSRAPSTWRRRDRHRHVRVHLFVHIGHQAECCVG